MFLKIKMKMIVIIVVFMCVRKYIQGIQMEEEKFFITERILNDSKFKGIHGILKHR